MSRTKLKFNQNKIECFIRAIFPNAKIESFNKFSTGLISPTFTVKISNPEKILVVKLSKLKNKNKILKNNKILNYLNNNKITTPQVLLSGIFDKKFITVMEYCSGNTASALYKKVNQKIRTKILFNAGKDLKKIHSLKIPNFWVHQHHEIKNQKEWKQWTKLRIDKYLKFFRQKWSQYYDFIEVELNDFWNILNVEKIDFMPLHLDYHLSNFNCDNKGNITGIFDFDNAMKGHSLADIGITSYFLTFDTNDYKNFGSFMNGYKKHFTKNEIQLIKGYFLLHLLAVTRSIWFKQKRLGWIINKHKLIIGDFIRGKI